MRRRRLLVLLAAGALAAACGDSTDPQEVGSLSGTIRDAATDAPLAGATVTVAGVERQTRSDGSYHLDEVPVGTHQGTAAMTGYVTQTFEAEVRAGAATTLALELAPGGPAPLTITTAGLPAAMVDVPYETSLEASGGTPPYRWTTEVDPPGLATATDGIVAGTPGYPAGAYVLTFTVYDAENRSASAELVLDVRTASGLRITSLELTTGEAHEPYVDTVEVAGGTPPYTFEWANGIEGLTLDPASGILSGAAGPTGPHGEPRQTTVTVTDFVGASALAVVRVGIRPAPLVILTDLPDAQIHELYRVELMYDGGVGGAMWTVVAGELPPGLRLIRSTLYGWTHLEGTPRTLGSYSFTLQVETAGIFATRDYTMVVADRPLVIVTSALPDGKVGIPYSVFLVREGGTGPYQWDIVSGSLPDGVALTGAGELTGTPSASADASFEVRVRDALGQNATAQLTLHVEP